MELRIDLAVSRIQATIVVNSGCGNYEPAKIAANIFGDYFRVTEIGFAHLDRAETEQYVKSHMDYAECSQEIFTAKAMDEIHKASVGIPRMINRVCEKSLMYAFQQQKRLIDDYMTKYVVEHEMPGTVTG